MVTFWRTCWFHVKLLVLIVAERGKGNLCGSFPRFYSGTAPEQFYMSHSSEIILPLYSEPAAVPLVHPPTSFHLTG